MAHETVIGKERRKMTQCMIEEEEEVADDDPGIVSSSIFPGKRRSSRKRAINNASNRNCHRGSEDSSIDLFLNIVSLKLFILLFVFSFSSSRQTEPGFLLLLLLFGLEEKHLRSPFPIIYIPPHPFCVKKTSPLRPPAWAAISAAKEEI
jgi:hypothetical protein